MSLGLSRVFLSGVRIRADNHNHYYPFGLNHTDPRRNAGNPVNLYQYNGKELVEDNGLGWNHYGARAYDAAVGRWWVVDPLLEAQEAFTPYHYVYGNPVKLVDPDGRWPDLPPIAQSFLGSLAGSLSAIAEDISGSSIPAPSGDSQFARSYSASNQNMHAGMAVLGTGMMAVGADAAIGGGLAMATVVGAPAGAPTAAAGVTTAVAGGWLASNAVRNMAGPPNPNGSKGKPDHQAKVRELEKKAQSEAGPGEKVLTEKKIQGQNSNRRPDVQKVDKNGKANKVYEAERNPNSSRNKKREAEYKKLGIDQETHPVGKKD